MALERTSLGNPVQGLQRIQANPDAGKTSAALSGLMGLAQGVEREYTAVQNQNMERKAQTDIINQTVNPDLEKTSGIYKGMVIQSELASRFNTLKDELKSGKYSDTDPEEFQKMLTGVFQSETEQISKTKYPDIYEDIHSKFWLDKQPVIVAAHRAMHYEKLKQNQELIYTKTLSDSLTPDMEEAQMDNAFSQVFHKSAGNAMSTEKQLQIALSIASNHAMNGSDTLLKLLDKKYSISNVPEFRVTYNAAEKAFAQAALAENQGYIVSSKAQYTMLADEGVFGNQHISAIQNDPKLKGATSTEWLTNTYIHSLRQNLKKRSLDNAYLRLEAGHDIGNLDNKDFNTVFDDKFKEINQATQDPEERGQRLARFLRNQTQIPDTLKRETQAFSIADPINKDGSVNPHLAESYKYFRALETTEGVTQGQFNNSFKDEDLKNYAILRSYMGTMGGDFDKRFQFAAGKLKDIQSMSGLLSPETVRYKYEAVDEAVEDKIAAVNPWWKLWGRDVDVDSERKRNLYKSNIVNIAKSEIRRGLSPDAALEYSVALADKNWEHAFGQLQQTGGVSVDVQAGVSVKGKAQEAYEWVVQNDPEVKEALVAIYGEGYNYKDLSTVLQNGTLQIGGDTEKAVYMGLETMIQKYENGLPIQTKASQESTDSVKNDNFATRLQILESDSSGRTKNNKLKAVLDGLTLDEYLSKTPEEKTRLRTEINQKVGSFNFMLKKDGELPMYKITMPSGTLAAKNNNPGNLRYAGQQGASEGTGGFAKFDSVHEGYLALKRQIQLDASRDHTLGSFINKYAPPTENNTSRYIKKIKNMLGLSTEDTPLYKIDQEELAKAMAKMESGAKVN